jgi:hypothetical protein
VRSLVIRPGLETADPGAAVARYVQALRARQEALAGKRVLVFGYGGRFDVGIGLLEAGAGYVILCDKYAPPADRHNALLLRTYGDYVELREGRPVPRRKRMNVMQTDIRGLKVSPEFPPVDLVISNSVYEHLEDVDGSTRALAAATRADGLHIHFVDLRDHFFKYPFEMLHYSEGIWRRWLNPTSNHNRLRLWDYRRVFETYFRKVEIEIIERDEHAFRRAGGRVRREFTSGNLQDDSVTLVRILATDPRR